jgi:hypothetical protein
MMTSGASMPGSGLNNLLVERIDSTLKMSKFTAINLEAEGIASTATIQA